MGYYDNVVASKVKWTDTICPEDDRIADYKFTYCNHWNFLEPVKDSNGVI